MKQHKNSRRTRGRTRWFGGRRQPLAARHLASRFEQLEDRHLLAAGLLGTVVLQSEQVTIDQPGAPVDAALSIMGGADPSVLAFRVHGNSDGTLAPAVPLIQDDTGTPVTPVLSLTNSHDAMLLAALPPGDYRLLVSGQQGTIGTAVVDVFLLGDLNGDGKVDHGELLYTTAATIHNQSSDHHVADRFFRSQDVDVSADLYHAELDANFNGRIDPFDIAQIQKNLGAQVLQSTIIVPDIEAPVIEASLRNDTGRDDLPETFTDGITHDVAGDVIVGTLSDRSAVTSLRAAVDGTDPLDFADVPRAADGVSFALTLADLEQFAGGATLENNGPHTLSLIAEDELGNASVVPFKLTFEFDTIAPAAPADPDLTQASDVGVERDDNVTRINTPTITTGAEAGTLVELLSDDVVVGQAAGTALVSIETSPLADGSHVITAVATDRAGNRSESSAPLTIQIDTVPPATLTFDLATPFDTGDLGDHLTSWPQVDLVGTTEPGATVVLPAELATEIADDTGSFSFTRVDLSFGENDVAIQAFDAAGNRIDATETFTLDTDPQAGQPLDVTMDEGDAARTVDLTSLLTDADLGQGDQLTLAIAGTTNPDLVTASLSDADATNSVVNDQLTLALVTNTGGSADVTIRATDNFGRTATGTVHVTVQALNSPPTAVATTLETNENSPVEVDLRTLASDQETADDDLLFQVDAATNGTVELLADGHTARFTPTDLFHGQASFTYAVTDTGDGTAPAASSGDVTITVNVGAVNSPPEAVGTTLTTTEDNAVEIDLRTLVDDTETPDDDLTFSVAAGQHGTVELLADGHTARFTPDQDFNDHLGTAGFTYAVTDTGDGNQPPATVADVAIGVTVTPVNDPPTAVDDSANVPADVATADLDVLANDTDPDLPAGDTLTIDSFQATSDQGASVTLAANGTFTYDPGSVFAALASGASANDQFTYTVVDAVGAAATATVHLTVVAAKPPIAMDDAAATDEATPIDIDVLADNGAGTDTDPDGDDALLVIDHFDATSAQGASVVQNGDGTLRYDPTGAAALNALAEGQTTTDTFQYTVRDEHGDTDQATVTVTVTGLNDAVTATDDTAATDEDTETIISVLGNDSDPDANDTLVVDSFDATSAMGAAVTDNGDGTFTYDPRGSATLAGLVDGQSATDTFQYAINDGHGSLATATVTVTINGQDDTPVATDDEAGTDEQTSVVIPVLDNDHDADAGDALTLNGFDATSTQGAAVTDNGDGTLTYDPSGSATLNALAAGAQTADSFQYTVTDSQGHVVAATVAVTVTGLNDPPTAAFDAATTDADKALDIDVLHNDSDPDTGDTLQVESFDQVSAKGATITLNADGTLNYDPTGSATLGALPGGNAGVTTDTFTYTVTDGHAGGSATETVTLIITGVNDNPTAVDDLEFRVAANSEDNPLDVLANDSFAPDVGETLSIVAVGAPDNGGTVTIDDQGTGLHYTPAADFFGADTFTYTIEDGNGGSDQGTVVVQVAPVVAFLLQTIDGDGNPVSAVGAGDPFFLDVFVQDTRPADPAGVFAAYLDVEFDPSLAVAVGTPVAGSSYPNARTGDASVAGLIDEVGGTGGLSVPAGHEGDPLLLFKIQMTAVAAGVLTITTNPADLSPLDDVLVFGSDEPVPTSLIFYPSVSLQIVSATAATALAVPSAGNDGDPAAGAVALLGPGAPAGVAVRSTDVSAGIDPGVDLGSERQTTAGADATATADAIATHLGTDPDGAGDTASGLAAGGPLEAVLVDIAPDVTQSWTGGTGPM